MCIQSSMNGIGEESMNGIGEEMKGGREIIDKESCIHNCHHPEGWNQVVISIHSRQSIYCE